MSLRLMIIRLEVVEQPAFRAALLLRDGPARGALVRAEASGHSGRHLLGHTTSLDALARVVDALALRPLALRAPPSLALREDLHVACPGIRAFLSVTTGLVPEPAGALLKATLDVVSAAHVSAEAPAHTGTAKAATVATRVRAERKDIASPMRCGVPTNVFDLKAA
eukprot:CAMPEP_0204228708 /NCGR_PEP_ID=MMETSP0361-20130328/86654_1 /ASSEMBLY_ACC=CAM_ASM_000343 /TAXON_ID=268821 /ORGANISM="Scrippsiella Hangoei, Strain SHTV-5" /LENGTH=165 /DNA_ID=CAMNT_0051196811 /DNA_START=241 /DNA_END=735 /DNA_ORIENTATION=+